MMAEEKLKVGDIVWVNETSASGKILEHEWEGEIIGFSPGPHGTEAKVQDLDSDREIYWRPIRSLKESDRVKP